MKYTLYEFESEFFLTPLIKICFFIAAIAIEKKHHEEDWDLGGLEQVVWTNQIMKPSFP